MVHRKLARTADHRASLLRNLVTNVLEHESITTTHAKAKEAQVAVERLITSAKRLNEKEKSGSSKDIHRSIQMLGNRFYNKEKLFPKVIGELSDRYANFSGGYTRILKLEPRLGDNAPQSILELVNGKRDMRMSMTARSVARSSSLGEQLNSKTAYNVKKLTRTPEMKTRFEAEVEAMREMFYKDIKQGEPMSIEGLSKRKAPIAIKPNPLSRS